MSTQPKSAHNMNIENLLSPKTSDELEEMAQAAHHITTQRFGRTIKLYAPVYISNSCINGCAYCGFASRNKIERRALSKEEVVHEAETIISRGLKHILLVSGEDPVNVPLQFLEEIARLLRPKVASLTIEGQPFDIEGYKRLARAGIDGVTLYQETYDPTTYEAVHPYGPKRDFKRRLEAIDTAGHAGMRFLGIGALLGLADWHNETRSLIAHANYLIKKHWQASVSVSIPRIRDSASGFDMPSLVSDRDLAQIICALRLALPDAGIVLSTRESAHLRDKLLPLGVTQMSAGSVTKPGGYSRTDAKNTGEQFHLKDNRSPDEVAAMLSNSGYDPVWKDWDQFFTQ